MNFPSIQSPERQSPFKPIYGGAVGNLPQLTKHQKETLLQASHGLTLQEWYYVIIKVSKIFYRLTFVLINI